MDLGTEKKVEQAGVAIWQGARGALIAAVLLILAGWGVIELAGVIAASRGQLRKEVADEYSEIVKFLREEEMETKGELRRARCLNTVFLTAMLHDTKPTKEEIRECETKK